MTNWQSVLWVLSVKSSFWALGLKVMGRGNHWVMTINFFSLPLICFLIIFFSVSSPQPNRGLPTGSWSLLSPGRTCSLQHAYWEQLGESALLHHTRCAATNPGHRLQHRKREAWDHQISAAGHFARQLLPQRQRPRCATKTWRSQLTNLLGEACFGGKEIALVNRQITFTALNQYHQHVEKKPHCELV